jgi:DNA-directed RNA polymerase
VNNLRQINGIIPNIIHSFDASHLINLLNIYIDSDMCVLPVHDCFGTLPNEMVKLASEVRKQFILLYSGSNFLENFHKKLLLDIKYLNELKKETNGPHYISVDRKNVTEIIYIPELPKMGTLELKQIEKSKYMIC